MHDDPADLDGDGQFDLIDLDILDEEQNGQHGPQGQSGCLVLLVATGGLLAGAWWGCLTWFA